MVVVVVVIVIVVAVVVDAGVVVVTNVADVVGALLLYMHLRMPLHHRVFGRPVRGRA